MSAPAALFISDLHLSPERPRTLSGFYRFIEDIASQAGALYILGDFFDAWVGDDDLSAPFNAGIVNALKRLSEREVSVFFLAGNRDFLVGAEFARAAGLTLLSDPARVELFGVATLLTHGDALCTDDLVYQQFRRQMRDPAWQQALLARPIAERHALARSLREQSDRAKAGKKPEIMDVNAAAVAAAFRAHQVTRLIHGHTHRPAHHSLELDGVPRERWVLPDWYGDDGGYLRCEASGTCQARALP